MWNRQWKRYRCNYCHVCNLCISKLLFFFSIMIGMEIITSVQWKCILLPIGVFRIPHGCIAHTPIMVYSTYHEKSSIVFYRSEKTLLAVLFYTAWVILYTLYGVIFKIGRIFNDHFKDSIGRNR